MYTIGASKSSAKIFLLQPRTAWATRENTIRKNVKRKGKRVFSDTFGLVGSRGSPVPLLSHLSKTLGDWCGLVLFVCSRFFTFTHCSDPLDHKSIASLFWSKWESRRVACESKTFVSTFSQKKAVFLYFKAGVRGIYWHLVAEVCWFEHVQFSSKRRRWCWFFPVSLYLRKYTSLTRCLANYMRQQNHSFPFTSISVNIDYQAARHRDRPGAEGRFVGHPLCCAWVLLSSRKGLI